VEKLAAEEDVMIRNSEGNGKGTPHPEKMWGKKLP
jgi:hypothetical protein